jgi:hypothetical protein
MLMGVFPVARLVGGAGIAQDETLRYLAELPWNPDAILDLVRLMLAASETKTQAEAGPRRTISYKMGFAP